MLPLTVAEIDRELSDRTQQFEAITSTLLELDNHPGLNLVRHFPPTGLTAQRWDPVRQALDLMWEDHGRMKAILDQARTLRGTRGRVDDRARVELTQLLRGRPHEAGRTPIPMAQRSLTGPSEHVLYVGLADTLDRMRATFPRIAEFLEAVDAVNNRVVSGLGPLQPQVELAKGVTPEFRAIANDIDALMRRAGTDPLSLTAGEIDARVAEISAAVRRQATVLTELNAVAEDWPAAVAETRRRWESLRQARDRAMRLKADAERRIVTAPLPARPDPTPLLGAELSELAADSGPAVALLGLRRRIADAEQAAHADAALAQGLLDRRAELHGRLGGYQAKAARLGLSEDREVLAAYQIAAGLLGRTPCDLAAVTRAVADYQQLLGEKKAGRTR
ncbi:hypothetical protein [Nocardia goodfellowii]|uniref:Uncharacterized protein n=1 Tax=Nocardia goodfellowii TaxID=882446 RepID=A0ABS4QLX0_9NOCA|nr:hypothetical protein [Nocardia goodfellowii]MBP2191666.1 hypothetical protein [Nocardia goodfellowii]